MNAFATWKGEGFLIQTGERKATFSGTLVGNMYILTDKGPQLFGGMICPASIDIGLENKSQTGGARCVITGIQPAVAQIIVGLGLDMQGVVTLRSLREGLRYCLRRLGFKVQREVKAETLLLPEPGKDNGAAPQA